MLQSPAKRRKTSTTTSVAATDQNTNPPNRSTPTTPTRASYLSPTKASLARSHPHLVSNNNARSLTEPRGRFLRNELLGKTNTSTSQMETRQSLSAEGITDKQMDQERVSQPEKEPRPSAQPTASTKRSPLQQRQPSAKERARQRSDSAGPKPPQIVPTLVRKSKSVTEAVSRVRSNEPELPPTPVQLGLDAPPERPRGLSSSSPRGSKSGSGRHRVRTTNGQSVTSSPLKPKRGRPAIHDLESQADTPEEDLESQEPPEPNTEDLPEELKEKTQTLRNLRSELTKLSAQALHLERAVKVNDVPEGIDTNDNLLDLLKIGRRPVPSSNADFEQEQSIKDSKSPYLDLFAPGNLQLHTKTATKMVKGHAKVIHRLSVAAPSPWPSDVFSANFEVITDAEEVLVEKVVWTDAQQKWTSAPGIQAELQNWIEERLKSDLHRLDVGGLVWGIGTYFNASVKRARTFKALAQKYKVVSDDFDGDSEEDEEVHVNKEGEMTEDEATILSRYLLKSQLTFIPKSDDDSVMTTRRSKKAAPKIIAIWRLKPTWHGEVESVCEIAPSGIPDSAHASVTELFDRVMKVGGFHKAFGEVWDLVTKIVGNEESGGGQEATKGGAKKRKRFS